MSSPAPAPTMTVGRQGNYAGAVSRLVAFAMDVGVSWGVFTAAAGLLSLAIQLFTGKTGELSHHEFFSAAALAIWLFVYFTYSWAVSGKTLGMAIFGVQVVTAQGARITSRQAVVRTLTLPLSIVCLGLGFVGILFQRERRAWHDLFAGTCVIYYWDARAARLRWLSHHEVRQRVPSRLNDTEPVTTQWSSCVDQGLSRHDEVVIEFLCIVSGEPTCLDHVSHRIAHVAEPGVVLRRADHEGGVAHPEPGVATHVVVGRRPTPVLEEEEGEVLSGLRRSSG